MDTPQRHPAARWTRILALLVGVVLVFALVSVVADAREVRRAWGRFEPAALGVAACLVLGNYALRLLRWELYLRVLRLQVPRLWSALIFFSGFVMSISPGKLGEVLKSALLYQYRGIPVEQTAPIVLAERLLDLVSLLVLVALAAGAFQHGWAVAGLGACAVLGIFLLVLSRGLFEWAVCWLERIPAAARLAPRLREAHRSLRLLMRPAPLSWGTLLGVLGWSLECGATFIILRGFADTQVGVQAAAFSYSAGTLVGALAMLPGGLGITEAGMTGFLLATARTLDPEEAMVATLLVRFVTLWLGVFVGAVAYTAVKCVGRWRCR